MNIATAITIAPLAALTPTVTTLIAEIRSEAGSLRAEMNALRKEIHSDLLLIHERVATVEAKNNY